MPGPYSKQAINTLKAGRMEMLLARMFGAKSVGRDGLFEVEIRQWRGKSYLVRTRRLGDGGE